MDYSGFIPENWQLQFPDGEPVHPRSMPGEYASKEQALRAAKQLSEAYQTVIVIKNTYGEK